MGSLPFSPDSDLLCGSVSAGFWDELELFVAGAEVGRFSEGACGVYGYAVVVSGVFGEAVGYFSSDGGFGFGECVEG